MKAELIAAALDAVRGGQPARRFKDFRYTTLDSWGRERRVMAKPRWQATRPTNASSPPRSRLRRSTGAGSTRRSTAHAAPSVVHLMAYVLFCALRRSAWCTRRPEATCGTIRLRLLKLGALVRIRRDASSSPWHRPILGETSSRWLMCDCGTHGQTRAGSASATSMVTANQ